MKNKPYILEEKFPASANRPAVAFVVMNNEAVLSAAPASDADPDFTEDQLADFDEWKAEYRARRAGLVHPEETEDEVNTNPNIPFLVTQDEWYEHILRLEEGEFVSWEDAKKQFRQWDSEYEARQCRRMQKEQYSLRVFVSSC